MKIAVSAIFRVYFLSHLKTVHFYPKVVNPGKKLISDVKSEYSFATQTMDQNIWSFQQRPWMRYGNEGDRLPYNKVPVLFIKFRWNETEFRYWDPNWAKYYKDPLKDTNPPKIMRAKHNW